MKKVDGLLLMLFRGKMEKIYTKAYIIFILEQIIKML